MTRASFFAGLAFAKEGFRLGDLGHAVQEYAERHGYGVVYEYTGHGVGKALHEDPSVPNLGTPGHGLRLRPGMTLAIEPMINMGTKAVVFEQDGWTVRTRDRKPAAHFEFAVAVRKSGPDVLTDYSIIEQALKN